MYHIYVIVSDKNIYIGQTNNLKRRFYDHKNKFVKSTKRFVNIKMFIIEKVDNRKESLKKEKYYKSFSGREKVRNLLKNKALEEYRDVV